MTNLIKRSLDIVDDQNDTFIFYIRGFNNYKLNKYVYITYKKDINISIKCKF